MMMIHSHQYHLNAISELPRSLRLADEPDLLRSDPNASSSFKSCLTEKGRGAIKGRKNSVRFETLINSDMCVTRTLLNVKPHLDEKILIVESEFCAGEIERNTSTKQEIYLLLDANRLWVPLNI